VLGATPVPAGVGSHLVNGDGDTAGKCLSIADTGRGSAVLMEPCNLDAHQGWRFGIKIGNGPTYPPPTDGHSRIRSQDADAAGRCLTAHGHAEPVTMEPCAGPDSEIYDRKAWTSSAPSGNWFGLWNRGAFTTVQCLDVRDRGRSDVVQNVTCGPANQGNQRWKLY